MSPAGSASSDALPARWHPAYLAGVLAPDYRHARAQLLPLFLDALTAHALGRVRVGTPHAEAAVAALHNLRGFGPPAELGPGVEDLFFTLDRELSARTPPGAGALRTALSRNDLDMTVYRLDARAHLMAALRDLRALRRALLTLAVRELGTIMVAFTHHQPAQPTTLAHYLAGAENALARDTARLHGALDRLNHCPLGAVALGGSSHALDRPYTAALLGFAGPVENTYDAVASGDWQTEIAGALSTCALTSSRLLYDLLDWAARGLLTLPDGLVQGSSVMPQKRNPVALEHARTRLSKVLGHSQAVLMCSHNVPFGDINDPGTDVQEPLHALWRDFGHGLALLTASLEGLSIDQARWRALAEGGDTTLTELADHLARFSGGDFRAAHHAAQQLLAGLRERGLPLSAATDADLRALGLNVPDGFVQDALDVDAFVARRTTLGGPAPSAMQTQLELAETRLMRDAQTEAAWEATFEAARQALRRPPA